MRLTKQFMWLLIGQVFYNLSQWGLLIILAKLGNPEEVGRFSLGLAITAPIFAFSNMELRNLLATETNQDYSFQIYWGLRIIATLIGITLVFLVALIGGYSSDTTIVMVGVGLAKGFESLSDLLQGLMQQKGQLERVGQSQLLKSVFTLVCFGGVYRISESLALAVGAMTLVWLVIWLLFDLRVAAQLELNDGLHPSFKPAFFNRILKTTLPLSFSVFIGTLTLSLPRYYIEAYHGENALGYFSALFYLKAAASLLFIAIQQTMITRMAVYYKTSPSDFRRLLGYLFWFSLVVTAFAVLVIAILGRSLLHLFYGAAYAEQFQVFVWLMVGVGPSYMQGFLTAAILVMRSTQALLYIQIINTLITLIFSALLIPNGGILGASQVLLITTGLNILLMLIHVLYKNFERLKHDSDF